MAPARTSPVPARASAGVANGNTIAFPSGLATTVKAPFRTTTCPQASAHLRALASRSAWMLFLDSPGQDRHLARMRREDHIGREPLGPFLDLCQKLQPVGVNHGGRQTGGSSASALGRDKSDPTPMSSFLAAHDPGDKRGRRRVLTEPRADQECSRLSEFLLQHLSGLYGDHAHFVRQQQPGGLRELGAINA